jgi:acyl carrier protein
MYIGKGFAFGDTKIRRLEIMAMNRDEILNQVTNVLVDALGLDDGDVTENATLMGDLGAESIDFLDIVFRLEKAFNIKVQREELFPADAVMSNPDYISGGKVTAKGLAELKSRMPHTDFSEFEKNPDVNKVADLFTVGTIVNFIESKLK